MDKLLKDANQSYSGSTLAFVQSKIEHCSCRLQISSTCNNLWCKTSISTINGIIISNIFILHIFFYQDILQVDSVIIKPEQVELRSSTKLTSLSENRQSDRTCLWWKDEERNACPGEEGKNRMDCKIYGRNSFHTCG